MRGTPLAIVATPVRRGIIPAYAGNTSSIVAVVGSVGDHPRVCGEHDRIVGIIAVILGSSPRMRGTLYAHDRPDPHAGIIPAYAGNTESVWLALVANWDHPRVCGEHRA